MILADTSLWTKHLRVGHPAFTAMLARKQISVHWVVIGELATGNLPKRAEFLATIKSLQKPGPVRRKNASLSLKTTNLPATVSAGTTCNCSSPRVFPGTPSGRSMPGSLRPRRS